ncbi:unnamed protein product [Pedinophyceae sp. YPF-701]|nr:unnamed protein product [Pedinophyceae sp. YPF-701]
MGSRIQSSERAWVHRVNKEDEHYVKFVMSDAAHKFHMSSGTLGIPVIRGVRAPGEGPAASPGAQDARAGAAPLSEAYLTQQRGAAADEAADIDSLSVRTGHTGVSGAVARSRRGGAGASYPETPSEAGSRRTTDTQMLRQLEALERALAEERRRNDELEKQLKGQARAPGGAKKAAARAGKK